MKKIIFFVIAAVMTVVFVSGCSTVPKKMREEVSGIRTRVETLETKVEGVETKQQDVERLASEQAMALDEMRASRESRGSTTNVSIKSRSTVKGHARVRDIQACLKNAGYYDGKIDGVKGKGTRKAIRQFQEANGLKVDGVVGPKTWEILSKYSSGYAGGIEEGTTK